MTVLQGAVYPAQMTAEADLTGSTVTLTVTAPDGTTTSPAVTTAAAVASANVPASLVGTYLLVWSVTGALAGAVQDQFSVVAPTIDLISLSDLRDDLHIGDTSKDVKLRRWIRAAGEVVENVTGAIRPVTRVETFHNAAGALVLAERWVSKIVSVVEATGNTSLALVEQTPGTVVNGAAYTWDRATNTLTRTGWSGGRFARTVTVTYVAGLTVIPEDIQLATSRLIGHWYRKNENPFRGGGFGGSNGDDAINMPGNYMVPNEVMELLEPWRRPPGVA